MQEELDILKIVADNPSVSQRKISEQTGISLGQVNFLIKKCVKKGLIKIEGQTTKSIKYNLTPKGISEKATLTMQYIKVSYAAVIALTDKICAVVEQAVEEGKTEVVSTDLRGMELIDSGNAEVIPFNAQGREPDLPESKIYVCGDHDEIMEIVKLALKDNSISLEIWDHESFKRGNMDLSTDIIGEKLGDCFRGNLETNRKSIVLYWDESYKDLLESIDNIKAINVLH